MLKNFNLIFIFLMGLIFGPFFFGVGPLIEMKVAPVVSRSSITRTTHINPLDEDWLKFWGTAKKLRQCNYDHVEWFSGDPQGAYTRLTVELQEHGKVNMADEDFNFGPVKVYINETQLRHNTFAVVYHKCHPLWLSQSLFFP